MRHYNATAHLYNMRYEKEQIPKIENAVQDLESVMRVQGSILDVGCGTGLLIPKMEKYAEKIVCLDVAKKMLEIAKHSGERLVETHFIVADADNTPLRPNYFDTVFAVTLLQNMPKPHSTIQEVIRVAKPKALIVVTGLKKRFTKHFFLEFLLSANLTPKRIASNEGLKCHVVTCTKKRVIL